MPFAWRAALKGNLPLILGAVAAVCGFVLMRVSAIFESWPLLFMSFGLMVWGIVALFNGGGKPRDEAWRSEP